MSMKKAVIITGQLRTVELTKWFHKNYFIDDDVDIFLSIDLNNKTQCIYKNTTEYEESNFVTNIINFYNPKDYYVGNVDDDEKIYNKYKELCNKSLIYYDESNNMTEEDINLFLIEQKEKHIKQTMNISNISLNQGIQKKGCLSENNIKGLFRQYYFVKKGYELLNNYKNTNNKKYDIIIRIRFDHIFLTDDLIKNYFTNYDKIDNKIIYSEKNIIEASKLKKINLNYDKNINENTINVIGGGIYRNKYVYINDFYWTHDDNLIETMMQFYDELYNIIYFSMNNFFPIYGAGIEHYLAVFLYWKKIKIVRTIMNNVNIIRKI